ncbi:restriction endonuclease subunit S [Slackia isoflavoniconvertens]|uniref:Type I restriction modification DNA specificity domain-containing protein n=1 Tax=Slackia isoflavoniconvertens TaxID=572010 RepID=A0A3N0IFS9_9ACTN|nr:restriction endonuclease subunit S [Slackia isoflavoniconvertens]MBB3278870.1 type I restriction enzyme S subunit [Slackia isoflavoniconvertens]RNM35881.1 hypothetical protein DMP05_04215 [Slackia isoflavoniconvertens]
MEAVYSGCWFIGDIPGDWRVARLDTLANLFGRIGWQGLTSDEYQEEGAWLVTGTDFHKGSVNWDSCVHVPEHRWEEAVQIQLQEGDLLITKDGTIGKLAIIGELPGHASLNSGVMRIASKAGEYDTRFLYYVLRSEVFRSWFKDINAGASTIQHLFQGDFKHFLLPFPTLVEQERISGFLDVQIFNLDEEVSILEKQAETLERYKESLIHEAVTKGLDKTVGTKPSGVEWIGDIPEHWSAERMKYVCETSSGTTPDSGNLEYYDGSINWIQSGDLYNIEVLNKTSTNVTTKALVECSALKVYKAPFVVVAMYGASIGNSALSIIDACTNQACCALVPGKRLDSRFLRYAINAAQEDLRSKAIGGTQPNISQQLIKNEPIAVPPISEQKRIADALDSCCANINSILDIKRRQIDVLKRRRESLIYEYVTGKRRVEEEA